MPDTHHVLNNGDPACASRFTDGEGVYVCTRRDEHTHHEAFDGEKVVAEWNDDEALTTDTE